VQEVIDVVAVVQALGASDGIEGLLGWKEGHLIRVLGFSDLWAIGGATIE